MAGEPWRMGASDLAQAIRSKQLKSREVLESLLGRIAAVNPALNAVTATLDSAFAEADAADEATAAGRNSGPLHGVPFSVKENIDVGGSPTTQGIRALAEAVPPLDAPMVARLREAGGIPFARTNLPDFGLRWHTDNELRGATVNPWNRALTAGGSSGGEAVALAAGMTPLGLGNDVGGSLRWPSQCSGTVALKPTLGRIAHASSIPAPEPPVSFQLMAVQGPMARHVRDLRLAFGLLSAPDRRDPWHVAAPLAGPPAPRRAAVTFDPGGEGVDAQVAEGVRRAADALRDAGYEVEEVDPPMVAEARDAWAAVLMTEIALGFKAVIAEIGGHDANRFLDMALTVSPPPGLEGYVQAFARRLAILRAWEEFQARYPIVLGPVNTRVPFEVGYDLRGPEAVADLLKRFRLVVALNLLGLPVVVVPAGVSEGLPQAVQVIGGRYREDLCLEAAEAIEQRLPPITPV